VLDRLPFFARRHKETPTSTPPTPPSQTQHA
jgi:hypothetical protein